MIDTIMIFAAGKGSRMRPITEDKPKTLIKILGKPILHYILEFTLNYPFKRIVINTHYLNAQINEAIEDFKLKHNNRLCLPEIITIHQECLLENGGAVKNAYPLLGEHPIFTLNGDVIIRSEQNIFNSLLSKWNSNEMDFLLLLQHFEDSIGYKGNGDFELLENGEIYRPELVENYRYMYAGLNILKPNLIKLNTDKVFSLKEYYLNNKKPYGSIVPRIQGIVVPNCKWYHANTPEDIVEIEFNLLD